MNELTIEEILNLKMRPNDANADTIKDYLCRLMITLWKEGEGFSGKRPFGNSNWEYELYFPLVDAGVINGHTCDDEYLEDVDEKAGYKIILKCINELFK